MFFLFPVLNRSLFPSLLFHFSPIASQPQFFPTQPQVRAAVEYPVSCSSDLSLTLKTCSRSPLISLPFGSQSGPCLSVHQHCFTQSCIHPPSVRTKQYMDPMHRSNLPGSHAKCPLHCLWRLPNFMCPKRQSRDILHVRLLQKLLHLNSANLSATFFKQPSDWTTLEAPNSDSPSPGLWATRHWTGPIVGSFLVFLYILLLFFKALLYILLSTTWSMLKIYPGPLRPNQCTSVLLSGLKNYC